MRRYSCGLRNGTASATVLLASSAAKRGVDDFIILADAEYYANFTVVADGAEVFEQ